MLFTIPIAGIAAMIWLLLIIVLHFIQPGLNPAVRMCSEYARGRQGWLMQLAFYSMASACLIIVFTTWTSLSSIGLILLFTIGLAFAGAGIFVTDPVFAEGEAITRSGQLHNLFAAIAILLFPVMETVITIGFPKASLISMTVLSWLSCIAFIRAMVLTSQGKQAPFGYYQRIMIFTLTVWIILLTILFGR